jgi:hypothetical protein
MIKIISIFSLLFIISCGKAVEEKSEEIAQEEINFDGIYMAILVPVNGNISNHVHGEAKITKFGDEFKVDIRLENPPTGPLSQSLNTGTRCPKRENDSNNDGNIDSDEAKNNMGSIIVPFDGDLSSQSNGENTYPSGSYHYSKSTSYYLMLSDLHLDDEVTNDSLVKLREKELPLERRVVAIYIHEMPLACGILTRITDTETPEDDDSWEEPRPPRPRPRPEPIPRPNPRPPEEEENRTSSSWWDRMRQRWERWRNRWNGNNRPQEFITSSDVRAVQS